MNLNLPIHHIGIACKNLEKERKVFENLGFKKEDQFIDETQGVIGEFMVVKNINFPQYRIELLQNINKKGILDSYLKNKIKMYHIAYESKDIQKDLDFILSTGGGLLVVDTIKASYFAKICFVMMSNNLLVELVELK